MPTAPNAAADMADSNVADFLFAAVGGERTRLLGVLRHYRIPTHTMITKSGWRTRDMRDTNPSSVISTKVYSTRDTDGTKSSPARLRRFASWAAD